MVSTWKGMKLTEIISAEYTFLDVLLKKYELKILILFKTSH